jgi:hypothetical protein
MKLWIFFLATVFIPVIATAQFDYYTTDSIKTHGIKLIDGGDYANSRVCQVKRGDEIVNYFPDEISEYGFKNGRIYVSFPVLSDGKITRYFFKRLVDGKINFYYLGAERGIGNFFILEEGNTFLTELPKKNTEFADLLKNVTSDCRSVAGNIPFVRYNEYSLSRFVKYYNSCDMRPLPRLKYGFLSGINAMKFSAIEKASIFSAPEYKNVWNLSVGAFVDIPVLSSNFSLHPEMWYSEDCISVAFDYLETGNDLVINYSSISFPFLVRYSFLNTNISPYFQGGPVYSRALKNESTLYGYESIGNSIYIDVINSEVMQNNLFGFSLGSGIISKYGSKYSWLSEIRYTNYYNLESESKILNLSKITFAVGLIF